MKNVSNLAVCLMLTLLTACGGGGSGNSVPTTNLPTITDPVNPEPTDPDQGNTDPIDPKPTDPDQGGKDPVNPKPTEPEPEPKPEPEPEKPLPSGIVKRTDAIINSLNDILANTSISTPTYRASDEISKINFNDNKILLNKKTPVSLIDSQNKLVTSDYHAGYVFAVPEDYNSNFFDLSTDNFKKLELSNGNYFYVAEKNTGDIRTERDDLGGGHTYDYLYGDYDEMGIWTSRLDIAYEDLFFDTVNVENKLILGGKGTGLEYADFGLWISKVNANLFVDKHNLSDYFYQSGVYFKIEDLPEEFSSQVKEIAKNNHTDIEKILSSSDAQTSTFILGNENNRAGFYRSTLNIDNYIEPVQIGYEKYKYMSKDLTFKGSAVAFLKDNTDFENPFYNTYYGTVDILVRPADCKADTWCVNTDRNTIGGIWAKFDFPDFKEFEIGSTSRENWIRYPKDDSNYTAPTYFGDEDFSGYFYGPKFNEPTEIVGSFKVEEGKSILTGVYGAKLQ